MLTAQEIQYIKDAFNTAVKMSPDPMAASGVLTTILHKIEARNYVPEETANVDG